MSQENIGTNTIEPAQRLARRASTSPLTDLRQRILHGYLLPTAEQLLHGLPFMGGDMGRDMRTFAETLLREIDAKDPAGTHAELRSACRAMLESESLEAAQATAEALRDPDLDLDGWSLDARSGKLRCWLYAVYLRDKHSIIPVAVTATAMAYQQDWSAPDDPGALVWRALGWLTLYAGDIAELFHDAAPFADVESVSDRITFIAEEYRSRMLASMSQTCAEGA
ncbi:hypothetical protein [Antarcticirhabdus aurantiaca]|uniref:Uncharacterized protein n=1 Tax=Antarcticirhabdus aurantiaca TaxID=2606717 RepID=A0ACD4NW40_9HYPH|nr:hypothetical protein [Antarcticirhabdus aurantiaca]WAJ30995.1 hypothetical protein OXU80_12645 [Jeongeuplla avenae]